MLKQYVLWLGVIACVPFFFTKPGLFGGVAAAAALVVAVSCAMVLWARRRRQVFCGLRNYGLVEFTAEEISWKPDGRLDRALPLFGFVIVPLLIGMPVPGAVTGLLWGQGMFELVHDDFRPPASWIGALAVGYGIFYGGGCLLFRKFRQKGQAYLTSRCRDVWKKAGKEARMAELDRLVQEIGQTSRSLDVELVLDITAGANGLFREVSEHYPTHTDAAVVRATFALCQKRLLQFREELAEDVALFWEAIAAIAEAENASGTAGSQEAEVLARLSDLKERLFAPRLRARLNTKTRWWEREKSAPGDYRNIVQAIIQEAQALAVDNQGEGEGTPIAAAGSRGMGTAEAYAVLGMDPASGGEGIGLLYSRLMELWAGEDAESQGRRQELRGAYAVLQQKGGG